MDLAARPFHEPSPAPPLWRSLARTVLHSLALGALAGLATAVIFSSGVGVVMWQEKNIEFEEIPATAWETLWEVALRQTLSGALAAVAVFGVLSVVRRLLKPAVKLDSPADNEFGELQPPSPMVAVVRANRENQPRSA